MSSRTYMQFIYGVKLCISEHLLLYAYKLRILFSTFIVESSLIQSEYQDLIRETS